MSLTLPSLVSAVNAELKNHAMRSSSEAVGDGESTAFLVPQIGKTVIDDDTWAVYADGILTTAYTMDFESGVCTFTSAPADGVVLSFVFNYVVWVSSVVSLAVDAGIDSLFPSIYVEAIDDTIVPDDFDENELEIDDCEAVIGFMQSSGTGWTRIPRKNFELYKAGGKGYLRWYGSESSIPSSEKLRLHYVRRAAVADLPDRVESAVVSYACYYLLTQKIAERTRSDIAIVTQGTGSLSPRQMSDASNAFYLRYKMQLEQVKMRPWAAY